MARILELKTNASSANATYPYGNIEDDSGANDGVPVDKAVYSDFHQFFARLIDQANNPAVVINNLPDNGSNGFQFYEALLATKTTLGISNEIQTNQNKQKINYLMSELIGTQYSAF
jgi:hypothetical protein